MSAMDRAEVEIQRNLRIQLPDGFSLNATAYLPKAECLRTAAILALTPYLADHLHDRGVYFAARGFPFVAVDTIGRGDSDGEFRPWQRDARDACEAIGWLARQSWCDGKIGMYGGSYLGYVQWVAAKELAPHLETIVPTASPYLGVDVPMRSNIFTAEEVRWQAIVAGRASHMKLFSDGAFWTAKFRTWYESGRRFRDVDVVAGVPSEPFQEYLSHPEPDAYWDSFNPSPAQYAQMDIPILTITGIYDGDQLGSLEHYKQHLLHASSEARDRHCLVIGPWNHSGCAIPAAQFDGITVGQAGVIDMLKLHVDWYRWILQSGPRPEFLRDKVTYYVTGAERWRYTSRLEDVTERTDVLYLHSVDTATDMFTSGAMTAELSSDGRSDQYQYDPRDISGAKLESELDLATWIVDQRSVYQRAGKQLIYHSLPFREDTEVSGFFRFVAWISIDQPDTDFRVWIYEIAADGGSVHLAMDSMRARYRQSLREAKLIRTTEPQCYNFERFTFTSRLIRKGNRLRLVIGPVDSIYEQKNYNSGGLVSEESIDDARPVTVRLFHGGPHPSALYVPIGRTDPEER